jgi:hypothetical protein
MTSVSTGKEESSSSVVFILYYNIIISYPHQIIKTSSGGPFIA